MVSAMAGPELKQSAKLVLPGGKEATLPVVVGSEDEHAIDIKSLRTETGYITLDSGYMNTGSTTSAITYLDGEQGILRYRGYSIEDLAEHSDFVETSYLLINGKLPTNVTKFGILIDSTASVTYTSLAPVIDGATDVSYGGGNAAAVYKISNSTLTNIVVLGGTATINVQNNGTIGAGHFEETKVSG